MTKQRNRCLNFFKGIACFGVIGAHMDFQGLFGQGYLKLISWTVPFFFMISGYYSYYEEEEKFKKKNHTKIKNILRVTIISLIFYFFVTFINEWIKGDLSELFKIIFRAKTIFDILVVNDFTAINAGHLWFLISLVYCYLILEFVVKHKKTNWLYWSIPILLTIRLFVSAITGGNWHYLQNVFMCAIPCFATGYYAATHQEQYNKLINKLTNHQLIIIIIVSILINFIGAFIKLSINIFEIGIIIAYISIFTFAMKNPVMYVSKFFETVGIKYSAVIYITHMLFILITRFLFNKLGLSSITGMIYIRALLVVILTLLNAIICEKILTKMKEKKQQV